MMSLSSDSLPEDPQQCDQEGLPAFETLYDRYHGRVYRYLFAQLKDEHDAADLTQQVFFQSWKQRHSYDAKRGSVATWILSIAHHRLIDFYRVSRQSIPLESIAELSGKDENPEAQVISEDTISLVRELIEALSQSDRELLSLRFAAELSSAEIAATIGKSQAATKKQLTRVVQRLREEYRRRELETPLPGLLEPGLLTISTVFQQIYAVPLPVLRLRTARQNLLSQVALVSS